MLIQFYELFLVMTERPNGLSPILTVRCFLMRYFSLLTHVVAIERKAEDWIVNVLQILYLTDAKEMVCAKIIEKSPVLSCVCSFFRM